MKSWEKGTKLNNKEKAIITMCIAMSIFMLYGVFITKNIAYASNVLLWLSIALIEHMNFKIIKGKDLINDIDEEYIAIQDKQIKHLIKKLDQEKRILKLEDIKIPEKFKKPNKTKLKIRTACYKEYKCFIVPIIIDKDNQLIDGYTTYLIAKEEGFSHIECVVKSNNQTQ